jgi:Na+/melibiose symporter-like transporter
LILAYLFNGIANGIPAALFLLFVEHVLGRPELSWLLLAVYFCAGLLGFALWLPLARRLGKHRSWALAMLFACGVFIWVPLLPFGEVWPFMLICLFTGLSLGVDMSLPSAIQADVVDLDRAHGGGERAGLFFGLWGMTTKLALALAIGLAYPLIEFAGFDPATETSNLTALVLAYGLLPIPFKLVAAGLVWRFPLNRQALNELQRKRNEDFEKQVAPADNPVAARRVLDHGA